MAKKYKVSTIAHVPAAPGTKLIVFSQDWEANPDNEDQSMFSMSELQIVAWEIRKNTFGNRWASPVASDFWTREENHAIIHPDGHHQFIMPYGQDEFVGTTLDEFADHTDRDYREANKRIRCLDCGIHCSMSENSPILKDEIWKSIVPDGNGMLCREHMEARLGRELTPDDLRVFPPHKED